MTRTHRVLAFVAAVLGCAAGVAELRPGADVRQVAAEIDSERDHISALDLAERIRRHDPNMRVLDLRSRAEFEQLHIPGAHFASIRDLAKEATAREANIVLYSEGGTHAAQAWVLLRMRGMRNVFVLREGMYEWVSRVMEPRLAADATPAERAEFARAAELSRYFGGAPRAGVPRSEVPTGYWTGRSDAAGEKPMDQLVQKIRKRGC